MTREQEPRDPGEIDVGGILRTLTRHRVDFLLVGGLAGIAHGSAYPSYDVDVAYERERTNLERLFAALQELGATLRGAPGDLPFVADAGTLAAGLNFIFDTRLGPLDVIGEPVRGWRYERLADDAVAIMFEGIEIRVVSLDHLIAMKRAANRPKDQLMVAEYIALADEIRRGREDV